MDRSISQRVFSGQQFDSISAASAKWFTPTTRLCLRLIYFFVEIFNSKSSSIDTKFDAEFIKETAVN